ncbi:MAG TPA: hypothetical protein H9875_07485 [Candidatus Levilactobacillus faecigallinarum]|uniref:Uncharacterized protein n=1 Tax=Candidatus Levilactobacillus faecigallinarum TaxID=2838638 RepID=A0A9D1U6G7_9LACO|nr:hypothetical protein [Candidatus Levilactobacillus faecigallinarum]
MKKKDMIALIVAVVIVLVGGNLFIKTRVAVSENRLASNINRAVQNKDGKLFLKQFSKDNQNIKFSDIGAQSVVKDLHDNATDPTSEIGKIITDGRTVAGTKVDYRFTVESRRVMGLFTSYYLTTRKSPVQITNYTGYGDDMTVKMTSGGKSQTVTKSQLSSGLFPGRYDFDISSGGEDDGSYWVRPAGDGDTIELTVTSY